METAWLIEIKDGSTTLWLAPPFWIDDAVVALRFSREKDAECFIRSVLPLSPYRRQGAVATEHSFGL